MVVFIAVIFLLLKGICLIALNIRLTLEYFLSLLITNQLKPLWQFESNKGCFIISFYTLIVMQ